MLWPDDVTDEQLALAAAKCDEDEQTREDPPIDRWRNGYLWVTHLCSQLWCEQQMEYGFTRKHELPKEDPKHVVRGQELHLARELESEDYIDVKVDSDEDIFAIKALNLYGHLKNIRQLKICREVPIFGWIGNLFLMGKIDEIRWKDDSNDLEISEFKTRTKPYLPGKAQQVTHNLQVMIYQYLLTKLHSLDMDRICNTLKLSKDKKLGSDILKHCPAGVKCLQDLIELIRNLNDAKQVSNLVIEYSCQDKDKIFATEKVNYDEDWLLKNVQKCEEYWMGNRFAQGVDIEDAWKCSMCDFAENCDWRKKKEKECQEQQRK